MDDVGTTVAKSVRVGRKVIQADKVPVPHKNGVFF